MMSNKIEFFFVGVGKCGTSWVFEFLERYSIGSLPKIKEPYIMDAPESKRIKMIKSLYSSYDSMCDFSTLYYWNIENAQVIHNYNPSSKIIITVRKPSQRIISHFAFLKKHGSYDQLTLNRYLETDAEEIIERSNYSDMIQRYVDSHGRENVLVLPLEQLKDSPQIYVDRLLDFMKKERVTLTSVDTKPILPAGVARNSTLSRLLKLGAETLRKYGLLIILSKLKKSKFIRNAVYKEDKDRKSMDKDYSIRKVEIDELDLRYAKLLKEYCDLDMITTCTKV